MKNIMNNKLRIGAVGAVMTALLLVYSCKDSFLVVPVTGQLDSKLLSGKLGLDAALISAYSQINGRFNRMGSAS